MFFIQVGTSSESRHGVLVGVSAVVVVVVVAHRVLRTGVVQRLLVVSIDNAVGTVVRLSVVSIVGLVSAAVVDFVVARAVSGVVVEWGLVVATGGAVGVAVVSSGPVAPTGGAVVWVTVAAAMFVGMLVCCAGWVLCHKNSIWL